MAETHTISRCMLVFVCGSLVSAAPIGILRWMNPCGGGGPPVQGSNLPTMAPDEVGFIIFDVAAISEIGRLHAENLKNKILTHRLTMTEEDAESYMKNNHLDGFPEIDAAMNKTVGQTFLRDYDRLSRVAVFLEQVACDEYDHQSDEYKQDISNIEEAVYSALCYLEMGIYGQGLAIESYVTRDVMTDGDRNIIKTVERFERDYIISRDVQALEASMKADYEKLAETT